MMDAGELVDSKMSALAERMDAKFDAKMAEMTNISANILTVLQQQLDNLTNCDTYDCHLEILYFLVLCIKLLSLMLTV